MATGAIQRGFEILNNVGEHITYFKNTHGRSLVNTSFNKRLVHPSKCYSLNSKMKIGCVPIRICHFTTVIKHESVPYGTTSHLDIDL